MKEKSVEMSWKGVTRLNLRETIKRNWENTVVSGKFYWHRGERNMWFFMVFMVGKSCRMYIEGQFSVNR